MNTLSAGLQKIVDDYKNDLQKFITENNLDAELSRDIEERIFEKISTLENPTRKDILKILSEIGTPEEIFSEELNLENNEKSKNFFEKFHKKTNKIIFLGTFFELSKITNIGANFWRAIFLFCFFFLTPITDGVILPLLFVGYFIGFLLLRTRFFGFLFSLGLGVFFTILLVPSVILFGMYLSDFHIENIYPFMGISVLFPIGMVLGIFSLVLFILYFFRYAFTKKFFGIGFLVTAIVSFVVAISMGIAVGIDFFGKIHKDKLIYSGKEIIVPISSQDSPIYPYKFTSVGYSPIYSDNFFGFDFWRMYAFDIKIMLSNDEDMHIFVNKEYSGLPGGENAFEIEKLSLPENIFPNIDIKKEIMKNAFGVTVFRISSIAFPKNIIFSAGYHELPWNESKDVLITNSEKYTEDEKNYISEFCGLYKFNNDGKIECALNEMQIQQLLKNFSPKEI